MACWESNPIQPYFLCRHMVYLYAIQSTWFNKSCILELETCLVDNSGSLSYPFLGEWLVVGTIIPIFYLFIFFSCFFFVCLLLICFSSFDDRNNLCSCETLNCQFDFSKDLGLEFLLGNRKHFFWARIFVSVTSQVIKNTYF